MVIVVVLVLVIGVPLVLSTLWDRKQRRLRNRVRSARDMAQEDLQNRDDAGAQKLGTGDWATWRNRDRR